MLLFVPRAFSTRRVYLLYTGKSGRWTGSLRRFWEGYPKSASWRKSSSGGLTHVT